METPNVPEPDSQASTTESTSDVTEPLDRYECSPCGYVYEPLKGDSVGGILARTPFKDLPVTWRCPVCGARKNVFANIGPAGNDAGFKANYGYGFGVNTMTSSQKSLLIFGGLALAGIVMLSFYGLN
ncbi:rubredoxin [Oscillatoriales cyanobacterium LEGE 11467]|uniref:Rubredoxin n=1 Tax=Zarconia navalis LEGE 11467 TaxID=1828826 RepID=A0A928VUM3_9CYAN|nr:rubredoxin [Zarconia navalis]MBE9040446.1 rubredoxin [Zarconia navalis LEGE 11467]